MAIKRPQKQRQQKLFKQKCSQIISLLWYVGLSGMILNTASASQTQTKRSSRITSSRSFGTNVKQSSSNGINFDCPEEFGYYPHPTDCTQYYVCVFGGALLESCTGGLMYSHDLQTCDWPRNVGCEVVDSTAAAAPQPENSSRAKQQQQQIQKHVPSRVRFGSAYTSAPTQQKPTVRPEYHRQPSQVIQAQVQTIPPPPELKVPPNPVITSRGQPKPLLDSHEDDIAKLYADAHETLPVEEEESDRQQRVYRGQPSTVSQVQRDRDGIIHQASINAIPNHGKIGSYAFGSQYRDIEYQQQQQQQQQQQPQQQQYQPQQQQQQQQYQPQQQNIRQSTYRPLEIITTPQPQPQAPVRETYINKPKTEKPNYSNQQSLIYNTDYDDDLIAQIEQDGVYDQPTRTPTRHEQVTIRTLEDIPIRTTTRSPNRGNGRHTYSPTNIPLTEAVYDDFGDYYTVTERITKQQSSRFPDIVDYNLIDDKETTEATPTKSSVTKGSRYSSDTRTSTPEPAKTTFSLASRTTNKSTKEIFETTTPISKKPIRNRGNSYFSNADRDVAAPVTSNRGTHPPRTRPTLKPAGNIVSKAQEFVDIYRFPPSRPEPLYPQPTPDKAAAKCRKDVCLLPDCSCGGKEIPGGLNVTDTPQLVLITFDDSVNILNEILYDVLFNNKNRSNPNGCPHSATFYVSHEWTEYSQVQNLYADGHEIASHTVSHSFGEQFSQKKWTREVAGQREILAAYGGVKLSDVRGMRAPFLSVGGNKMYKMLYDSNFTYDSSMPVYENRPPSWPYTLDYKIFHDCMIPPCPTKSYPGVWQVPMVMWQDLNGGRCSMGDACSNPADSDGVFKMIMKNFERHYDTNRAPFGLFYHAAWFTQPHHKEGFIKFLDAINAMPDVWVITNWQMLQWVRDPTPISRINSFQPFQCDYTDRPKRCNNPKVCNLWHKSGVRYMKTCQPCPDIYPWTGKSGIRSSRIDNYDIDETTT